MFGPSDPLPFDAVRSLLRVAAIGLRYRMAEPADVAPIVANAIPWITQNMNKMVKVEDLLELIEVVESLPTEVRDGAAVFKLRQALSDVGLQPAIGEQITFKIGLKLLAHARNYKEYSGIRGMLCARLSDKKAHDITEVADMLLFLELFAHRQQLTKSTTAKFCAEQLTLADPQQISFWSINCFISVCNTIVLFFHRHKSPLLAQTLQAFSRRFVETLGTPELLGLDPNCVQPWKPNELPVLEDHLVPPAPDVMRLLAFAAQHQLRQVEAVEPLRRQLILWMIPTISSLNGPQLISAYEALPLALPRTDVKTLVSLSGPRLVMHFEALTVYNQIKAASYYCGASGMSPDAGVIKAQLFAMLAPRLDDRSLVSVSDKMAIELLGCSSAFYTYAHAIRKAYSEGTAAGLKISGPTIKPNSVLESCHRLLKHKINPNHLDAQGFVRAMIVIQSWDGLSELHDALIERAMAIVRGDVPEAQNTAEWMCRLCENVRSSDVVLSVVQKMETAFRHDISKALVLKLARPMIRYGIKSEILVDRVLQLLQRHNNEPMTLKGLLPFFHCLPHIAPVPHKIRIDVLLGAFRQTTNPSEECKIHVMLIAAMVHLEPKDVSELLGEIGRPSSFSSNVFRLTFYAVLVNAQAKWYSLNPQMQLPDRPNEENEMVSRASVKDDHVCHPVTQSLQRLGNPTSDELSSFPHVIQTEMPAVSLQFCLNLIKHTGSNVQATVAILDSVYVRICDFLRSENVVDVSSAIHALRVSFKVDMNSLRQEELSSENDERPEKSPSLFPFSSLRRCLVLLPVSELAEVLESMTSVESNLSASDLEHSLFPHDIPLRNGLKLQVKSLVSIASRHADAAVLIQRVIDYFETIPQTDLEDQQTLRAVWERFGDMPPKLASYVGRRLTPHMTFEACLKAMLAIKIHPVSDESLTVEKTRMDGEFLGVLVPRILEVLENASEEDQALMRIVCGKLVGTHPELIELYASLLGVNRLTNVEQLPLFFASHNLRDYAILMPTVYNKIRQFAAAMSCGAQIELLSRLLRSGAGDAELCSILFWPALRAEQENSKGAPISPQLLLDCVSALLSAVVDKSHAATVEAALDASAVAAGVTVVEEPGGRNKVFSHGLLSPTMAWEAAQWVVKAIPLKSFQELLKWSNLYTQKRLRGVDLLSDAMVKSFTSSIETSGVGFDDMKFMRFVQSITRSGLWSDECRRVVAEATELHLESFGTRLTCSIIRALSHDDVLRKKFQTRMLMRLAAVAVLMDAEELTAAFQALVHFDDLACVEEALEALSGRVLTLAPNAVNHHVAQAGLECLAKFQVVDPEVTARMRQALSANLKLVDARGATRALRCLAALGLCDRPLMLLLVRKVESNVQQLPLSSVVAVVSAAAELEMFFSDELRVIFGRLFGYRDWLRQNPEQKKLVREAAREYRTQLPPHIVRAFVPRGARGVRLCQHAF